MFWFNVPQWKDVTLSEMTEALRPLGVHLRAEEGVASYQYEEGSGRVLKSIGGIAVHPNGMINVVPCLNSSPREVGTLLAAGQDSFENAPSSRRGWVRKTRKGKTWWRTTIVIALDPDSPASMAIGAMERWFDQDAREQRTSELLRTDA